MRDVPPGNGISRLSVVDSAKRWLQRTTRKNTRYNNFHVCFCHKTKKHIDHHNIVLLQWSFGKRHTTTTM